MFTLCGLAFHCVNTASCLPLYSCRSYCL